MANEFIARKGLIVLTNGAKVTGSLLVQGDIDATGYNVTASNLQLLGSASIDGDITLGGNLTVGNADIDVVKFLAEVSSSILPDVNNSFDLGSNPKSWRNLYVSGTAYIDTVQATNIALDDITVLNDLTVSGSTKLGDSAADKVQITGSLATSGSNTFTGPQTIDGNITLLNSSQIRLTSSTQNTLFGFYDGTNVLGAYYQMWGADATASPQQIGSAEFVYDTTNNPDANFHVASFDGNTWTQKFNVNDNGIQVTGSANVSQNLTVDGNTTLGNTTTDTVKITGSLSTSGSNTFVGPQYITGSVNVTGGDVTFTDDLYVSGGLINVSAVATDIEIRDNTSGALTISEGSNNYVNITTTDGSEKVTIGNSITSIDNVVEDNTAGAFTVKEASNNYIAVDTTNGSEKITLGNTTTQIDNVIVDNKANAYTLKEGANSYLDITTTNNAELLTLGNSITSITSEVEDNAANAFKVAQSTNTYINVATTDNAEKVTIGNSITSIDNVIEDNTANAFTVKEGSNSYIAVDTTNNSELITFGNTQTSIKNVIEDNTAAAYQIAEGTNPYFIINTTDGSEKFTFQTGSVEVKTVQTISNTTNSTNYTDGALIVAGGVGIGKDVNISGSLTVTGLLTAVSMSTQYVTSSQYVVGTSRVIVNDDDYVRFAGLSVIDSGSTYGTGSLLWDSLYNRWIYQADDQAYNSAIVIAGPKNAGTLGDEAGLVDHRVPVAHGDDHIDSRPESSSIRIDFPSRLTHVEAGLYITGSVTSSVGFSGDGSNITGIVTNLNITGSDGGTGTVALKTQALTVDGTNGITATVNNQTITISGSNATTTSIGVASFNGTNFTVTGGEVTSNNITINNTGVTLGGTRNVTLQEITTYGGATTSDQVTLNGGAIIHGVLYSSGSNTDVDTGTEVVATVTTGSYDAAFFDYVVKKGSNYRAGTVMAVWEAGTTNVEFTDTSTNDLGNTNDIIFTVDLLSATARLKAVAASNDWIIKTAVRAI